MGFCLTGPVKHIKYAAGRTQEEAAQNAVREFYRKLGYRHSIVTITSCGPSGKFEPPQVICEKEENGQTYIWSEPDYLSPRTGDWTPVYRFEILADYLAYDI